MMGARQTPICNSPRTRASAARSSPRAASVETIADAVTRYVAERIVEREQVIEGDWLTRPSASEQGSRRRRDCGRKADDVIWGICGFGLGMIAGMFLLVAYAWFMVD